MNEIEVTEMIPGLLAGRERVVFFEIGACDGYHTEIIYRALRETRAQEHVRYYAFEPVPRLYDIIAQKADCRGVHLTRGAVGARAGTSTLHVSGGVGRDSNGRVTINYYGSSSIRAPKLVTTAFPGMTFSETTTPVVTLDEFCASVGVTQIDFLWADIQGAEIDLLEGGPQMLPKTDYVFMEYCNAEFYEGEVGLPQLLKMLPSHEVVKDFGGDVLLRRKP